MTVDSALLFLLAVAFAFANGLNDGGSLVATGLAVRSLDIGAAVAMLAIAVIAGPMLIGVAVARTLSDNLVSFGAAAGRVALVAAVVATLAVVWALASRGLPTSLTLGLVGAITGAGVGAGLPVAWGVLGRVLVLAAVAPFLAAAIALVLGRVVRRFPGWGSVSRRLGAAHRLAFALQCLAYGVNDGQKMLAVAAIAAGVDVMVVADGFWTLVIIAVAFSAGTLVGLRKVASTIGGDMLPMRPLRAVITEFSSSAAVISTGIIGAPVSMTQSIVGGLVGTGVVVGTGRVRWLAVFRLVGAWALTLPLAFGLSLAMAAAGRRWA